MSAGHGPIDAAELLQKVHLTIGQVAEMTGLSIRQISYWTNKGIISANNPRKRTYDYTAVEKAVVVKRGLDQGLSLTDAALDAEDQLCERRDEEQKAGRLVQTSARGFVISRLSELEALAEEIRRQINLLEQQGREEERRLAVTKLEVVDLLVRNPFTRDTAERIAARLGRAIDLVQLAMDELADQQAISRVRRGDRVICQLPASIWRGHGRGENEPARKRL